MVKQAALSYAESIGDFTGKLDPLRENDWPIVMEGVLSGLSHHIGNRVAVLSGVADILAQDESIPPILRALVDEVPKLEQGIRLLRLLVREGGGVGRGIDGGVDGGIDEAMELWRVVEDAVLIARMHPAVQREIIVERSDVAPVCGQPNQMLRDIVAMLIRAGTSARAKSGLPELGLGGIRDGMTLNEFGLGGIRDGATIDEFGLIAEFNASPLVVRFHEFGDAVRISAADEELWVKALR